MSIFSAIFQQKGAITSGPLTQLPEKSGTKNPVFLCSSKENCIKGEQNTGTPFTVKYTFFPFPTPFSKFNSVLDETSRYLFQNNINHVLVYGQIKQDKRDELIRKFQEDDNCFVLVINLSIGSEGLTLTEANNVIFINEAWNPSMNRQAEDRVNRIGQHRPVKIHILRSKATIDVSLEKILVSKNKLETEYVNDLLNEVLFVS